MASSRGLLRTCRIRRGENWISLNTSQSHADLKIFHKWSGSKGKIDKNLLHYK